METLSPEEEQLLEIPTFGEVEKWLRTKESEFLQSLKEFGRLTNRGFYKKRVEMPSNLSGWRFWIWSLTAPMPKKTDLFTADDLCIPASSVILQALREKYKDRLRVETVSTLVNEIGPDGKPVSAQPALRHRWVRFETLDGEVKGIIDGAYGQVKSKPNQILVAPQIQEQEIFGFTKPPEVDTDSSDLFFEHPEVVYGDLSEVQFSTIHQTLDKLVTSLRD